MEYSKLEKFKTDNPDSILDFTPISKDSFENIITKCNSKKISDLFFSNSPYLYFKNHSTVEIIVNNLDSENGFVELARKFNFDDSCQLIFFWRKNEIDLFEIPTLNRYWMYIWYDVADEAVIIFNLKTEEVIMVMEHNTVLVY